MCVLFVDGAHVIHTYIVYYTYTYTVCTVLELSLDQIPQLSVNLKGNINLDSYS